MSGPAHPPARHPDPVRSGAIFDTVAELYDRARPGYPASVLDDLDDLAGVGRGSRVLEIAPGTGQLSVPLARRGVRLTCVELGPELASVARRKLAGYPDARVEVARFEDWAPPPEPFDAVVCATAFHWLDPAVRVRKTLDVLRPGGALAVIGTHHVAGGSEHFFRDSQDCYLRWMPGTDPGFRLPTPDEVPVRVLDERGDPRTARETVRRHIWETGYSAQGFRDLLATYSPVLALEAWQRSGLLECLAGLIRSRYGDAITMRYMTELTVLHRR